jgi:hypothetical protein
MDTFFQLRKQARDIRDEALAEVRAEYADRLKRIAVLEHDLWEKTKAKHKRLTHSIASVIPQDRAFTTEDVYAGLEALDARRPYKKSWVISHLGKLCDRGILRRVQKNHGRQLAIYVRAGVQVEPIPFGNKTLPLAIAMVLEEHGKPLAPIEIAVRLVERGFQTVMDCKRLRGAVGACCRSRPVKFKQSGRKWGLAQGQQKP